MRPATIPLVRSRRRLEADLASIYVAPVVPVVTGSLAGGDISKIESGPCKVTYKSIACGHTQGGVSFSVKPVIRERKVDEHGEYLADLIYNGDTVQVKARFAEKTMQVVQAVYQFGSLISSSVFGIGYLEARTMSGSSGLLTLHPLDGTGTRDDVHFYKATISDTEEVAIGDFRADRSFGCTFNCLVDTTKSSGQLIGAIGVI